MHLFLYPVLFVSSLFAEKKIVSLGLVLAMLTMLPSQLHAEEADKNPAAESTQQTASSAGTGALDGAQAEQEQNKEQTEAQEKDQTEAAAEELADKISEEKLYPQDVRDLWPQLRELVTSPYGAKRSSPGRGSHVHTGLDIRAHIGWPIRSLQKGVVTEAGMNGPAGLMVQVQQEDGKIVTYAHMSEILASKGDEVSRGQHIGRVGCTGRTSGAHLHIAIKDASGRHINPRKEINGLWEVFDPPVEELSGPIESMACTPRERMKGGQANKRLIGTEHYLRMRKALPKKTRISLPEGSY